MTENLFSFADHWWFYAFVVALPALDLGLFHRKGHVVGFREAAAALLFCYGLYFYTGWKFGAKPESELVWSFSPAMS